MTTARLTPGRAGHGRVDVPFRVAGLFFFPVAAAVDYGAGFVCFDCETEPDGAPYTSIFAQFPLLANERKIADYG